MISLREVWVFCGLLCLVFFIGLEESKGVEPYFKNSIGMEFVLIQPGEFEMGSHSPRKDKDEIPHRVKISRPFYIQMTEVSREQYERLMGKGGWGRRGDPNLPITKVSWYDAVEFIERLNRIGEGRFRLPTEAEWEYAARAGTDSDFYWGNEEDCKRAVFCNGPGNCTRCNRYLREKGIDGNGPGPIKSLGQNPWGLYHIHGNVWEWCSDWYGPYDLQETVDPKGPLKGVSKVKRGGGFRSLPKNCRSSNRNYSNPESRYETTGFRVVMEIGEAK